MRHPRKRRFEAGQAIVEFVVLVTTCMVFMLVAVATLERFSSLRTTGESLVRYVMWERTVWLDTKAPASAGQGNPWIRTQGHAIGKSDSALLDEARQHVLSDDSKKMGRMTYVLSHSDMIDTSRLNVTTDFGGLDSAQVEYMLKKETETKLEGKGTWKVATEPYAKLEFGRPVGSLDRGAPVQAKLAFDKSTLGWGSAIIAIMPEPSGALRYLWPELFRGAGVASLFYRRGVLLTNAWTAEGSKGVISAVSDAVPTTTGQTVSAAVSTDLKPYSEDVREIRVGKIAPDVVPPDRLKAR
ncbi:hypothetical protein FCJ61_39345 [Burkholderia metallica]|uniref:hypothetical protein n=1 Tax=Burkholderia metallica TaxID=488729 RepID=UPI00157B0375|nr:hypothetical protein [Burkholderia metallica]NTZ88881.1 hypothetical protein [Burkholderia metallica]